jgi:hypothetical protein
MMGDSGFLGCDAVSLDQQFLMNKNYLSSITSQMTRIFKYTAAVKISKLACHSMQMATKFKTAWHISARCSSNVL